ncbi:MAG TPA: polysaccharide deacetylase family protein [bacterium]|nr:polysaccharide deacetylase family protein [bacterium]
MSPAGIPVVMYHCVSPPQPNWIWNYLITPVGLFDEQMRLLREEGWTTISLDLLYSHMAKGTPVPDKSVVLTFDDGYADNWMYAFPILSKYGHHAVIWMTTDFVDPRRAPRPTLEDVWATKVGSEELDPRGYLSWPEMQQMVATGLIEIQSHAKTHTWYFNGPEIIDFHRPSGVDGYQFPPWLAWNQFPERKYESLSVKMDDQIPFGTPIYQYTKSLVTRRYFEDPDVTSRLVETVLQGGGAEFFARPDWRAALLGTAKACRAAKARLETDAEYAQRVRDELAESRRLIGDNLGYEVRFLCWPGGGYNDMTLKIAKDVGYDATTTHYEDPDRRNVFGQNPAEINRIGSGSPCVWRGRLFRNTDPEFFIAGLEYFAGNRKSLWKLRQYKVKYLLKQWVGKGV